MSRQNRDWIDQEIPGPCHPDDLPEPDSDHVPQQCPMEYRDVYDPITGELVISAEEQYAIDLEDYRDYLESVGRPVGSFDAAGNYVPAVEEVEDYEQDMRTPGIFDGVPDSDEDKDIPF